MTATDHIRRARESDLDGIMAIFSGRRAWLSETMHSDQWANVHEWRHLLCFLVRRGHVWVLVEDEQVLGTITVGIDPDRDFWSIEQRRRPALYVSKLATDVTHRGRELGAELLDWAAEFAAGKGIEVLRLDTWKTSEELRKYYDRRGWRHAGTVDLAHRQSGYLFERDTFPSAAAKVDSEPPTGQFAVSALLAAAMSKAW